MVRKILSLDGGGIKGVFPASFLQYIEETTGKRIVDHFDLIVGTSTGGIIALGLGMGLSAKDVLSLYEEFGSEVFSGNRFLNSIKNLYSSKYTNDTLRKKLEEKFGDRKLGESTTRLVIPSLNLETGEVHVYKTSHHERFQRDYKEKAVDVALATSAAPTYFPTFNSMSGTPLVDGGLYANNPMGLAVVEAIGILEWPRDEIKVLSIGCTDEPMNIKLARRSAMGLAYWGANIVKLFMSAQSSASFGTAQLLAGHKNIFRFSPVVANGKFGLDVTKEIQSLKGLGNTEARKALPNINFFFEDKVENFEPKYKL